jgi:hypothetical protein
VQPVHNPSDSRTAASAVRLKLRRLTGTLEQRSGGLTEQKEAKSLEA